MQGCVGKPRVVGRQEMGGRAVLSQGLYWGFQGKGRTGQGEQGRTGRCEQVSRLGAVGLSLLPGPWSWDDESRGTLPPGVHRPPRGGLAQDWAACCGLGPLLSQRTG